MVYKYFAQDRSNQSLLMLPNMLKNIVSLDIYHFTNFHVIIQTRFKITKKNCIRLFKTCHDAIIIQSSLPLSMENVKVEEKEL